MSKSESCRGFLLLRFCKFKVFYKPDVQVSRDNPKNCKGNDKCIELSLWYHDALRALIDILSDDCKTNDGNENQKNGRQLISDILLFQKRNSACDVNGKYDAQIQDKGGFCGIDLNVR